MVLGDSFRLVWNPAFELLTAMELHFEDFSRFILFSFADFVPPFYFEFQCTNEPLATMPHY